MTEEKRRHYQALAISLAITLTVGTAFIGSIIYILISQGAIK